MALPRLPPVHPGEILRDEYLAPLDMSPGALAKRLHVPRIRIVRLIAEQTPVAPDTALRLAKFFNTSAQFWMNLQTGYDAKMEAADKAAELDKIQPMKAAKSKRRRNRRQSARRPGDLGRMR